MQFSDTFLALIALGLSTQPFAQQAEHPRGDHPAVVVKRMQAKQGYDYQAQFYPHPAWLYLQSEAPHPMMDHPAVIVARRKQHDAQVETVESRLERIDASIH
jgi:hypothetical protein